MEKGGQGTRMKQGPVRMLLQRSKLEMMGSGQGGSRGDTPNRPSEIHLGGRKDGTR